MLYNHNSNSLRHFFGCISFEWLCPQGSQLDNPARRYLTLCPTLLLWVLRSFFCMLVVGLFCLFHLDNGWMSVWNNHPLLSRMENSIDFLARTISLPMTNIPNPITCMTNGTRNQCKILDLDIGLSFLCLNPWYVCTDWRWIIYCPHWKSVR